MTVMKTCPWVSLYRGSSNEVHILSTSLHCATSRLSHARDRVVTQPCFTVVRGRRFPETLGP